jgi:4-amino-4-deoxy-L-arabinose transferase-like glycosyltransferase
MTREARPLRWHYVVVGSMGLALLLVSDRVVYDGPVLRDEVVYAVVARNVVEQGNLETHLYRADSIAKRGYPSRDDHLPGYMLILATSLAMFGIHDWALALPGQLAYLVSGLLLYRIGRRVFEPSAGLLAAGLFYSYPMILVYANLIMVESPLALVMVVFLGVWLRASGSRVPALRDCALLALLIAAGMILRPTFVVLLPPTLLILARPKLARGSHSRLALFGILFTGLLLGVFWPLSQDRAYYPSPFDRAMEAELWADRIASLWKNAVGSLWRTFHPLPVQRYVALIHLLLGVVSIAALRYRDAARRRLALLFVYLFWVPVVMLSVFYSSVVDLNIARNLGAFLLPGLVLLAGLLIQLRERWVRGFAIAGVLALFCFGSFQFAAKVVVPNQEHNIASDRYASALLERTLETYDPEVILYIGAFRYAWEHYPTKIIWSRPSSYDEMRVVAERVRIDGVVLGTSAAAAWIEHGMRSGFLGGDYVRVSGKGRSGPNVFVREELWRRARSGEE